jgi:hypothetical protein
MKNIILIIFGLLLIGGFVYAETSVERYQLDLGLQEKCFTVASSTFASYDNIPLWFPAFNITVASSSCIVQGSGGTDDEVPVTISDGTNAFAAYTCNNTRSASSSLAINNTFTSQERFEVDFGTASSTADFVNYCIYYTHD